MPYKFYYTIFCGIGKVFHTNCSVFFTAAGERGAKIKKIRTLFSQMLSFSFRFPGAIMKEKKAPPGGAAHDGSIGRQQGGSYYEYH